MLLTEEQARKKWCPHARSWYYNGSQAASINRDAPTGLIPACVASACMAWRWHDPKQLRDIDLVTAEVVDEEPRRGYCGAFGKADDYGE